MAGCAVTPDLLGITLRLPPEAPPALAIQHIARQLALRLGGRPPSTTPQAFWASTFLLASGDKIPQAAIERFLARTASKAGPQHNDI